MVGIMSKIKVGIVGGTGYTGVELIRLLVNHPHAQITMLTSRSEAGKKASDIFPAFAVCQMWCLVMLMMRN